jgi:RNA polymerase sigma factor (sigma-70 family)
MVSAIEKNNALYPAVVAGDAAARTAMILNNLGLVVTKANALIGRMPSIAYLRDDLVSAGNVGLVQAVNKLSPKVHVGAVNCWLGRAINNKMQDLLPIEHTIRVPRQSSALARHNGCPLAAPAIANVLSESLEACSDFAVVDLRDVMNACCQSDIERQCLRLHEKGYTFQEIGQRLGVSRATANLMFRKVKARILDYWTRNDPTPLEKPC